MQNPRRMKSLIILALAISTLILFAFVVMSAQKAVFANQPVLQSPTETLYNPDAHIIQFMEEELKNALDEETRKQIEGKLAILYREATARADAYQNIPRAPRNPNAPTPSIVIEEEKQTGIIEDPFIAIPLRVFQPTNAWQEKIGDSWVHVTAGIFTKEPSQGVLYVDFYGGPSHIGKFVPMPTKDGAVRIVDAIDYRLTLETEGGSKYYYDVPGLSFVSSLDEVVPTITPQPAKDSPTGTPVPPYP